MKQIDDHTLEGIVRILDYYEKLTPSEMEETAKFWTTPLGLEFSWATTNDLRKLMTCNHADLYEPKPFFTHIHKKNRVDCIICGVKRQSRNAKDRPTTCDQCGTKGVDEFYTFLTQAGMFIILGNICLGCKEQHQQTIDSLFSIPEEQEEEMTQDESSNS